MDVIIVSSIVNFAVFAFVIWFFGRSSVQNILNTRSETISSTISEADSQYQEAEKELIKWQSHWSQSKEHAQKLMEDAKENVAKLKAFGIDNAKNQAKRIEEDSKLIAEGEAFRAEKALRKEVVDRSIDLAKQYCKSSLAEGDKKSLVLKSLESVGG